MRTEPVNGTLVSPGRLLEMLTDRFGAFEAIAVKCSFFCSFSSGLLKLRRPA
jgi:hypothetical protein